MDKKPVLAVVIILGLVALGGLAGAVVLTAIDKNVPDGIWTLTAGASGALAALLTSTRYTNADGAAPVQVVNAPDQPVPVDTNTLAENAARAALGTTGATPVALPDGDSIEAHHVPGYATAPAPDLAATVATKAEVDTMGQPPAQG